ncbi:MAG: hypothetical protein HY053_05070 [Proteobacteria bacterium]|nr:hypothetical protein [Pseudomonadota bacterium]
MAKPQYSAASYYLEAREACVRDDLPPLSESIPFICTRLREFRFIHDHHQSPSSIRAVVKALKMPGSEDRVLADLKDIDVLSSLTAAYWILGGLHAQGSKVPIWEEEDNLRSARVCFEGLVYFGYVEEKDVKGLVPETADGIPEVLPKILELVEARISALKGRAPLPPELRLAVKQARHHVGQTSFTPGMSQAAAFVP